MQGRVTATIAIAGTTASVNKTLTEDGSVGLSPSATHAVAGTLDTRTSDTAGVIGCTGTDIVTGNKAVLTWEASNGDVRHRYNVDCTVAETGGSGSSTTYDVTFSGGSGDNLPDEDSDINIGLQVTANVTFDGDGMTIFVVKTNVRGLVAFLDESEAEKCVVDMGTNGLALWLRESGFTEPISGTPVTHIVFGSGSTVTTTTFDPVILVLYDATDPYGSGD